jgi:hypothetical protein
MPKVSNRIKAQRVVLQSWHRESGGNQHYLNDGIQNLKLVSNHMTQGR